MLFCSTCTLVSAQEKENKIPKKAGLYSAILPGSGQVYTKKYWKVPIIYAGLITSAYYIKDNNAFSFTRNLSRCRLYSVIILMKVN